MVFPLILAVAEASDKEEIPLKAGDLPFASWLTNSILFTVIVIVAVLFFARRATRNMQLVPDRRQNFFEALVEGLYSLLEGIVGRHLIGKCFGFLASIFIFLLTANWFGLIPGVGTIGWGVSKTGSSLPLALDHVSQPLLRPASADLNMTLGLAAVAMVLWLIWSLQEVGLKGFLLHIFGPKGGMTGLLGAVLVPVFFLIGILEVVSIATRPVSLSLRLFGNIYAGENILHLMGNIGAEQMGLTGIPAFLSSVIIPIPFYGLEIVVGLLQAFIFMLLCAVYIQLSTTHEEEGTH
ncbi:F0F1 ATP synthase subunit A [soil metagenome]